jgi:hypothetical protein
MRSSWVAWKSGVPGLAKRPISYASTWVAPMRPHISEWRGMSFPCLKEVAAVKASSAVFLIDPSTAIVLMCDYSRLISYRDEGYL